MSDRVKVWGLFPLVVLIAVVTRPVGFVRAVRRAWQAAGSEQSGERQ